MSRTIRVSRESFPDPPALDTAVSAALLRLATQGAAAETLRLHRPAPIVAFGPHDRVSAGYAQAVRAARAEGFAAVERLAGGRAAVFHEGTLAFSWVTPDPAPRTGIGARFELLADIMVEALRSLGVDARIGEVPGEYCPGAHSVNARGRTKLIGVGQRLTRGASHVGGVVVISGAERIRRVLVPVYEALGLAWDPPTAGSVEDEIGPVALDRVERAILDRFAARFELVEAPLGEGTLELARELMPRFEPRTPAAPDPHPSEPGRRGRVP